MSVVCGCECELGWFVGRRKLWVKEVDVCWEQLRWSTSFSFQSVGLVGPRYKKGCCVTSVAIATAAGTTAG